MSAVQLEPSVIAVVCLALAAGGFIKGVTGAGAPLVAVPVMASVLDVRLAIVVIVMPNLATNAWQIREHARGLRGLRVGGLMAVGALPGVMLGTALLTVASDAALSVGLAAFLTLYVLHRLRAPRFSLSSAHFERLALPAGAAGGFMQGAAGMSGPLALAFMKAGGLERGPFIANLSAFFLATSAMQIPALAAAGILTWPGAALSTLAVVPILAALPVGNMIGRRLSRERFDQIVLVVIAVLALRLLWRGLA